MSEQFIYAFVNLMTQMGLRRESVLELVHIFLLGHSGKARSKQP